MSNGLLRALVLEGGGMRGVFTAGVLEAFAEQMGDGRSAFDLVVACSAGACNAASFLAGQPWRNRRVYLEYLDGGKLIRWSRLFTGGDIMDIDYLVDEVTLRLCPLDLESLKGCPTPLHIGVTDVETGQTRYLNSHQDDLLTALRATCALPGLYRRPILYQGCRYVDGGASDPIPIGKAMELGARDLTVVLTSSAEARARKRWRMPGWVRLISHEPAVRKALLERYLRYKEIAEIIARPPEGFRIRVVRPSGRLEVSRTTRDRGKLEKACDRGYQEGKAFLQRISSPSSSIAGSCPSFNAPRLHPGRSSNSSAR